MSRPMRASSSAIQRYLQKSYAADYLGLTFLLLGYTWLQTTAVPFYRMFSLDDLSIQHPFADPERVPVSLMFLLAGGIPLLGLVAFLAVTRSGWHKTHVTILGLFISLVLTSFLTDVVKNAVGRPRPDLLARCKPRSGAGKHVLVTVKECAETDGHLLNEGWRSFPSGHSSFSFAGLGYMALFAAGQFHVLRPQADLIRVLVTLAPILMALLIAISRLQDYRHDFYDVTAGSVLGMIVAYQTYLRYYPSLRRPSCDIPYPSQAESSRLESDRVFDEEGGFTERSERYERIPLQNR